ncbi:MAG: MEDS domain-containing protein [Candidatus Rokubacteria bacterium]|nr:MEDS domain-containing protein [Candidatus Rokubacteria bacterium]
MTSPGIENLLIDAPTGRHFAQLHKDGQALGEAVGLFVKTGLRRGEGVVVIASAAHTELFLGPLSQDGFDPEACRRTGQLAVINAEEALARFMRVGMPDWAAFRQTIGGVIESLKASGRGAIRAYGEMVDMLWHEGNTRAAVRLEEYWNDLLRLHAFSLFCAYLLDGLDEESYAGPLHEIGRTHSNVLATEEDRRLQAALDAASQDVLGVSLSTMLSLGGREENPGEHRIPSARRTILWLKRNMPFTASKVLARARDHYRNDPAGH